jgi:hypothetical protein
LRVIKPLLVPELEKQSNLSEFRVDGAVSLKQLGVVNLKNLVDAKIKVNLILCIIGLQNYYSISSQLLDSVLRVLLTSLKPYAAHSLENFVKGVS